MYRCVRRRRKARLATRKPPVNGVNVPAFNGENGSAQDLHRLPRAGVSPQSINMNSLDTSPSINRQLPLQHHQENGMHARGHILSGTGSMQSTGNGSIQSRTRTIMRPNPAYNTASSDVDIDRPYSISPSLSYDYPRMPQGAARATPTHV